MAAECGSWDWYYCGNKYGCNAEDEDQEKQRALCFVHMFSKYNELVINHITRTEEERTYNLYTGMEGEQEKYSWASEDRMPFLTSLRDGLLKFLQRNLEKSNREKKTTVAQRFFGFSEEEPKTTVAQRFFGFSEEEPADST